MLLMARWGAEDNIVPGRMSMNDNTTADTDSGDKRSASIGPEVDLFCKHVDAIGDVLMLTVMAVQQITEKTRDELKAFEAEHCEVTETENERTVKIPTNHYSEWKRKSKTFEHFNLSRVDRKSVV